MKKEFKNYEEKAVRICILYYYGSCNSRAAFAAEPPQWSEGDTTVIDLTYEEFIKKLQN